MNTKRIRHGSVRGLWFTDMGQRVDGWVPPGLYQLYAATPELIDGRTCYGIVPVEGGHMWYVPVTLWDNH